MFDPQVKFRVGDAFSPDSNHAATVKLLLACRQLEALRRALRAIQETSEGPSKEEALQFGFLCVVGAAKEAADAFRDCDGQGVFKWLEGSREQFPDFFVNLDHLRLACDKSSEGSVYARLLAPIRNKSAFHFSRDKIAEALRGLSDEVLSATETDASTHMLGVPLARHVLAQISWLSLVGPDHLDAAMSEIDAVRQSLVAVGQDLYLLHVRLASEPPDVNGRVDG